jgi:copper chaperone CopZ
MKQVKYEVKGMTCGGCQQSVIAALGRVGIHVGVEDVSLQEGTVRVDATADAAVVRSTIEDAGYDVGKSKPA